MEDDEDLPEGATLFYDLGYLIGFAYLPNSYFNPCIFNNHILTCEINGGDIYIYKLSPLITKGGITWLNLKDQYIDIHRNLTLTFKMAHDLFFTDKWHFIVEYTTIKRIYDDKQKRVSSQGRQKNN